MTRADNSEDFDEATRAFVAEKRQPRFSGR